MCSIFQVAAMREPDRIEATLLKIIDLYNEGKIKPRIDSVWSFDAVSNKRSSFPEMQKIWQSQVGTTKSN